jgi:16S rRNA (cytidine1402-2'-O)-methyltransferase
MAGTLYVVGTPIGNLEDLTFRALRILKEVDAIAAEDTRRTAKLLAHYEIRKPLVSLREHNESRETPRLIRRLLAGDSLALVSDAGTPGIADPGARLVRAAHEAQVRVSPVPGASAVAAAVSVSGFPSEEFTFAGFPPRSGTDRSEWFSHLSETPGVVVFFEAPHRIQATLADINSKLADRPIVVLRELTKIHETLVIQRKQAEQIDVPSKGEFTVVVGPGARSSDQPLATEKILALFGQLTDVAGLDEDLAADLTARASGTVPSKVRKAVKQHRIWVKKQNLTSP